MKKAIIVVIFLAFPAICAAGSIATGDSQLDAYLTNLNEDVASGTITVTDLKVHIQKSFGLKSRDHAFMQKQGLTPAEHYLVGLIHKSTKASVSRIVGVHRFKKTWKNAIYFLGATPEELNQLRVADAKGWKKSRRHAKAKVSSKKSVAPAPATSDEKTMVITEDGAKWECRCRLKPRRRR